MKPETLRRSIFLIAAAVSLVWWPGPSIAQMSGVRHPEPPPEAFNACEGKRAGDRARFATPHGQTISGTCTSMNGQLVLQPDSFPKMNPSGRMNPIGGTEPSGGPEPSVRHSITVSQSGRRAVPFKGGYPIVDTGQTDCYGDTGRPIPCPSKTSGLFGQDAQFDGRQPEYTDHGDGTVTDNVTGLMWQKGYAVMGFEEAVAYAASSILGGHNDWRLPTIKEAYSLILFSGVDASSRDMASVPSGSRPFIDRHAFNFTYGSNGSRVVDTQLISSTLYQGVTMGGNQTLFGVNVADGRIKGYPVFDPRSGSAKKFTVRLVRGNLHYGANEFSDNGDGTVTDLATGLVWAKEDSKKAMNWKDALTWVKALNKKNYSGFNDWRLPNAKELQSIVDYTRSPSETGAAAIDPVFNITAIINEAGEKDFPWFWTSTTHANTSGEPGGAAVYITFGRALGKMHGKWMDVHGAGAQRSDPKTGDPSRWKDGHGPQGDAIRIFNFVRPVRDAKDNHATWLNLSLPAESLSPPGGKRSMQEWWGAGR